MKKLGILCSSSENANLESKKLASSLMKKIVRKKDYNYIMGAGATGMMHICQEILIENNANLKIIGIKESTDLNSSLATEKIQITNTFDRTKQIYEYSDILLFLSGGFGTMAELYSMLDANVETGNKKLIILYNNDHSYDAFLNDLKQKQEKGFVNKSIFEEFSICVSEEEVLETLNLEETSGKKE